jgi:RNA polymerase sigma-70 factor (ECF subfamily)
MQNADNSYLINECRQNNANAFRKLVEMHQGMVFSFAFRMLCNDEEAKDVVQETFIRVWKNMEKYNPEMKFTTWLFAIASNLCCDKLRSGRKKMLQVNAEDVSFLLSDENIERTVINSDLAKIIHALTDNLTPKQKLIFTLRDIEGFEPDEVEKITGMSAGKIKSNLYLARQFIRAELEKTEAYEYRRKI